jgi:hypothetical protein
LDLSQGREVKRVAPAAVTTGGQGTEAGHPGDRRIYPSRDERRALQRAPAGSDGSISSCRVGGQRRDGEGNYSPFDADGTLRDGLSVASGGVGECMSGSYIVVNAFRCFEGSSIRDVCYRDDRDPDRPSLLCVESPWARAAVGLQYVDEPDPSFGARLGGPPWALELASGRRCGGRRARQRRSDG